MRFLILLILAAAALPSSAAITNEDVLSMIRAGVPDSTVVATIGTAARRGEAQLDTSPAGLIALRRGGASELVLNAMISIRTSVAGGYMSSEPRGVSIGGAELAPFLLWQRIHTHSLVPLVGRRAPRVDVSGVRGVAAGAQPVFDVRGYRVDEGWQLVRFDRRDGRATLRLRSKSGSDFLTNAVFDDRDVRPLEVIRAGSGRFQLRAASALDGGEYALCTQVPMGGWMRACYPFAVSR
jgi:hypothetical protein